MTAAALRNAPPRHRVMMVDDVSDVARALTTARIEPDARRKRETSTSRVISRRVRAETTAVRGTARIGRASHWRAWIFYRVRWIRAAATTGEEHVELSHIDAEKLLVVRIARCRARRARGRARGR